MVSERLGSGTSLQTVAAVYRRTAEEMDQRNRSDTMMKIDESVLSQRMNYKSLNRSSKE